MIYYKLDYAIEKTLKQRGTAEQTFLRRMTGAEFTPAEARNLTEKINVHKWYVSERLGRDVGTNVAAADFFENIYNTRIRSSAC